MKMINRIIIICFFVHVVYANNIEMYTNKNTDLLLITHDNNYELLGYGGNIRNSADCAFVSKGKQIKNILNGQLYDTDISTVSYKIKNNTKYKFLASKNSKNLKILNIDTFDMCGMNTLFLNTYTKILNKRIYQKKIQEFIELLTETQENKNILKAILTDIKITLKTLTPYNNIAYYLQKAGANKEAIYLLEKIIAKFPNRTVAYYNLGDAYWELGDRPKAIKAYTTYIEQMCHKGLQKKIPKEVLTRVENQKTALRL